MAHHRSIDQMVHKLHKQSETRVSAPNLVEEAIEKETSEERSKGEENDEQEIARRRAFATHG